MNEDEKRKYDALQSLNDQDWAEFQEKTRLEWRLSFGLWSSMVTVIGSIFAGKATDVEIAGLSWAIAAVCLCIILIGLHLWFLLWIQKRLQNVRYNLWTVRDKMWEFLSLVIPERPIRKILKQPSLYVQLGITCVLAAVLFSCVFLSKPKNTQKKLNSTKDVPIILSSGPAESAAPMSLNVNSKEMS